MPKINYAKYGRKYKTEWEKELIFKGWLKKATDVQSNMNDLKEAYCSYCNVVLRAHHNDLVDHSKTAKHVSKKNSLNIKKQPTLNSFGISTKSNESKISDLILAVHIAAHSSVRSIDHLGEILKSCEINTDMELLEMQWRKLGTLKYSDICCSTVTISEKDSSEFWVDVYNIKDSGGKRVFEELAVSVLHILSLPLANAVVERVFSVMNAVKTKPRNRMQMNMLDAILRIRLYLNNHSICCNSFVPSSLMLNKFNSKIYENPNSSTTLENQPWENAMEDTITLLAAEECED